MYLERGKAKIKIESCVGKKTSSFLQNFKTAVNAEEIEEQHGSNWLSAEEIHIVWFWKWNWFFFLSSKLYPKLKKYALAVLIRCFCHSALLLTFHFCYYFATCSYPWRYRVLPRMYTACCNVFQPEMQQDKMHFYCRNSFCQRGPFRSAYMGTLAVCINPDKWGF